MTPWLKPPSDRASLIQNSPELRGWISVPLDHRVPEGPPIQIFYRKIPWDGELSQGPHKPYLVVINGGPGLPASGYRSLAYDYEKKPIDRLSLLGQNFNVILVDQRGTKGGSTAIDFESAALNPNLVAQYFGADQVALDHARVIDQVVPSDSEVYILAQSYGGLVGVYYMHFAERGFKGVRSPQGIIFASASLPNHSADLFFQWRRESQRQLNETLVKEHPEALQKLLELRRRMSQLQPSSTFVDEFYGKLGKSGSRPWTDHFMEEIDGVLSLPTDELERLISETKADVHILNYILSSAMVTPGETDRTMARKLLQNSPFEEWMVDEARYLHGMRPMQKCHAVLLDRMDHLPVPSLIFPTQSQIQKALGRTKVLFTVALDDSMIPRILSEKMIEDLETGAQKFRVERLPGGHNAVFLKDGVEAIKAWL